MESDFADRFISERIIRKLKDTLQAQSSLPQDDLSLQLSCMQASTSTLLEVKNILDGLNKKSIKNVGDILASSDLHFVLQRFLFSSYYFVSKDNGMAATLTEVEVNRPPGMLIFCPLYVAVAEVLTHLVTSQTFASTLSSTKILQLLVQDLNVLVLPNSEPDHFKMLLANIHFLWEVSKCPASSALFCNVSDTVLVLINVFVSYQGPFEQLTTLVKSMVMFIAADVADDETSVYLLAEESCIDFIVDILTKSVSSGENYLNYQGVYAVDIAKCIENLSQFAGLQEALQGNGVVELLVSMIQIGDPYDDSAAASALNALLKCYGKVDVPVLLQGLAANKDSTSNHVELMYHDLKEQEIVPKNRDQREVTSTEERGFDTDRDQNRKVASLDKNNAGEASKEDVEGTCSLKEKQQSTDPVENNMNEQSKENFEGKEILAETQYSANVSLSNESTEQNIKEFKSEVLQQIDHEEGIKDNAYEKADVSDSGTNVHVETTSKTTDDISSRTGEKAVRTEKPKVLSQESRECDINDDQQEKKEFGAATLGLKSNFQEHEAKTAGNVSSFQKEGLQSCDSDKDEASQPQRTNTVSTVKPKDRVELSKETVPAQASLEATNQSEAHKVDAILHQQEDISSYLKEQIKSMGENKIKYITIPAEFQPDLIKQPEPEGAQQSSQKPFHYQQAGTDPVSGQDLLDIHMSLIDLGVHNMYDEKLVGLLNQVLEESKLREEGVFDILNNVPHVYSYKFLRTGSMQRQLRVAPAHNKEGVNAPLIHVQPEIDYHLVLKKFIFQIVPDHGSKMDFPGFTLIGPWLEKTPVDLEEWSFCFVPCQSLSARGKEHYYLSADRLKQCFLCPMLLSFVHMNLKYRYLLAKGESLGVKDLQHHGITVQKIEENGPAVTVHYFRKYLTVDYVLSLRHLQWPLCATEWADRQRHWPDSDTVKDVVNYGCHLVPKQPATLSKEDPLYGLFFQYSFARAENILLNKLNEDSPVLTECLRMLKFLCEMHFDRPQLLKSYHMQTVVLLAAERLPLSHWKADNFVKHLLDLLDDLLHFLVAQYLPNYFIKAQNLFQQFSPYFLIDVARRVSKVRKNPIKYLTPSDDPERFGIYLI